MKYINLGNEQPVKDNTLYVDKDVERIVFDTSHLYDRFKGKTKRLFNKIVVDPENKKFDTTKDINAIIEKDTLILATENTTIPEGVKVIGVGAYAGIDTPFEVVLPDSCKELKLKSIIDSNITSFKANDGLETIGAYAFYRCPKLEKVYLSKTVSKIKDPTGLEQNVMNVLEIDNENKYYGYDGKALILKKDKTLLNINTNLLLKDPETILEDIKIIEAEAFSNGIKLEKVCFKDVEILNKNAFTSADIETLIFLGELKEVRRYAFNRTSVDMVVAPRTKLDIVLDKDAKFLFLKGYVHFHDKYEYTNEVVDSYTKFILENKELILRKFKDDKEVLTFLNEIK